MSRRLKGSGDSVVISLGSLKDKHAGRAAVVVGAGPSARRFAGADGKIVLAVNSGVLAAPEADYFVSADVAAEGGKYWPTASRMFMILGPTFHADTGALSDSSPAWMWNAEKEERLCLFYRHHDWVFSSDGETIEGSSSAHCAADVARIMGCSPIYLVGCDCVYEDGKRYFWQFPEQPDGSFGEYLNYWQQLSNEKEKFGPNDNGIGDGHLGMAYNGWMEIREANPDVKIISASKGVLHKVFPQASIESLAKPEVTESIGG